LFTRTAIDKYTGTAKDGMLYSIEAVTGTDEENNIVFEGRIEGITKEDVSNIEELRVGKYTSVGFGRCSICLGMRTVGIKYLQRKRRLKRRKISHKNAVV